MNLALDLLIRCHNDDAEFKIVNKVNRHSACTQHIIAQQQKQSAAFALPWPWPALLSAGHTAGTPAVTKNRKEKSHRKITIA